jgi:hypothetical protein
MKFRKMVRWQLLLAGLSAVLFFTTPAHSQEITNTAFDDGLNVTPYPQPVVAQPSTQAAPVQTALPSIQASVSTQNPALLDSPWVTAGITLILFICVALSAVGESKRANRNSLSGRGYASHRRA